jgi:16S rRNA (cytosine1402-N4)-methyltransferase
VNTATEEDLIRIFKEYGEVFRPSRVVRAIVNDRKTKAFQSTAQLAGLIERVDGWQVKGHHPATKYFMALRLAVNSELEVVGETLPAMMKALKPGGRLAVITFHSLEDRIVKNIFRDSEELGRSVYKKVVVPSQEELDINSRSRSAKLRVFERSAQDEQREL